MKSLMTSDNANEGQTEFFKIKARNTQRKKKK